MQNKKPTPTNKAVYKITRILLTTKKNKLNFIVFCLFILFCFIFLDQSLKKKSQKKEKKNPAMHYFPSGY